MVGFPPIPDLPPGQITKMLEPGRMVGAFVGGQLVGTACAATSTLTLPGGATISHAAVTDIGVLPTFTRQGIATDLMRHLLNDFTARDEVVASLRASEATIYGRYGYGVASSMQSAEITTARAAFRPGVGSGGPVRLVSPAEAWEILPRIYDANRPSRPGTIDRPGGGGRAYGCAPNYLRVLGMWPCTASPAPNRVSPATARPTPTGGSSATSAPLWSRISSRRPPRPISD